MFERTMDYPESLNAYEIAGLLMAIASLVLLVRFA